jgi:hypothetical protein
VQEQDDDRKGQHRQPLRRTASRDRDEDHHSHRGGADDARSWRHQHHERGQRHERNRHTTSPTEAGERATEEDQTCHKSAIRASYSCEWRCVCKT